jgi:hypothetical protein
MKFRELEVSGKPFVVAPTVGQPWVYTADDVATCEISDSNVLRVTAGDDVTYLSPSAWISVNGSPVANSDILDSVR